jgi:hypothetical protein
MDPPTLFYNNVIMDPPTLFYNNVIMDPPTLYSHVDNLIGGTPYFASPLRGTSPPKEDYISCTGQIKYSTHPCDGT